MVVERIDFDKLFGWASAGGEPIPAAQEGKSPPVPAPALTGSPFELSLIAGQFIFFGLLEPVSARTKRRETLAG
jgi:hypothetical protein